MTEEKELKYKCSECDKDVGVVFVVLEKTSKKQLCSKCYYKKDDTKN